MIAKKKAITNSVQKNHKQGVSKGSDGILQGSGARHPLTGVDDDQNTNLLADVEVPVAVHQVALPDEEGPDEQDADLDEEVNRVTDDVGERGAFDIGVEGANRAVSRDFRCRGRDAQQAVAEHVNHRVMQFGVSVSFISE